jgi:carbamoyltransferase
MNILGINAYHGDASACLVKDGKLIAACEEERFNRVKHCAGLPILATQYCLKTGNIKPRDIDYIAISRNPMANFFPKAAYALSSLLKKRGFVNSRFSTLQKVHTIKHDLAVALQCGNDLDGAKLHYVEHHLAHMASSFFVSPFDEAALLSIDGFGDFVSTKIGFGRGNQLYSMGQVAFPHSAGIIYTAVSQYIGFTKYGDEGKVMGLAPYGQPRFLEKLRQLVQWHGEWEFRLNLDYFKHHDGSLQMSWLDGSPTIGRIFSDKFIELLGPLREKEAPLTQYYIDIAASLQALLEEIYFRIVHHLHEVTKSNNLCIAGGVALNSVCNGKLFQQSKFKEVYIQAAAGDGGTSVGAAFYVWNQLLERQRGFIMENAYTGPAFSDAEIVSTINALIPKTERQFRSQRLQEPELYSTTAEAMAAGKIVGWFQGGSEFGPRALGNRSIVVDPRRPDMKDILNSRIKHREAFRPFAPSMLAEHVAEFFEESYPSPFMLMVYKIKAEKQPLIPAVTHVDGTGRLQTVTMRENPRYYQLIQAFYRKTGIPLILNTSFNENEPIVNTPAEAINCFLKTKMDILVLGNHFIERI